MNFAILAHLKTSRPPLLLPHDPQNAFLKPSDRLLEAEIPSDHFCTQNREEEEIFHLDLDVIVYFVFTSFCVFILAEKYRNTAQGC